MIGAREKLIEILDAERKWPDAPETADAILTALPEIVRAMVKPLVWYDTKEGQSSEGYDHHYEIYENSKGTFTLDDGAAVLECEDFPSAYHAANNNYAAQIMAALGLEVKQ